MQFVDKKWYRISDGYNTVIAQYIENHKTLYPHAGWLAGYCGFSEMKSEVILENVANGTLTVKESELWNSRLGCYRHQC